MYIRDLVLLLLLAIALVGVQASPFVLSSFADTQCTNATRHVLTCGRDACVSASSRSFALVNTTDSDEVAISLSCDASCQSCSPSTTAALGTCMKPAGLNAAAAGSVSVRAVDTTAVLQFAAFADDKCTHTLGAGLRHDMPSGQCVSMTGTASFGFVANLNNNEFVGGFACSDSDCTQCKLQVAGSVGDCVSSGRGFFVQLLAAPAPVAPAVDDIDMGEDWEGVTAEFHSEEIEDEQ